MPTQLTYLLRITERIHSAFSKLRNNCFRVEWEKSLISFRRPKRGWAVLTDWNQAPWPAWSVHQLRSQNRFSCSTLACLQEDMCLGFMHSEDKEVLIKWLLWEWANMHSKRAASNLPHLLCLTKERRWRPANIWDGSCSTRAGSCYFASMMWRTRWRPLPCSTYRCRRDGYLNSMNSFILPHARSWLGEQDWQCGIDNSELPLKTFSPSVHLYRRNEEMMEEVGRLQSSLLYSLNMETLFLSREGHSNPLDYLGGG